MSVHTASQEDTSNARPSAYSGDRTRKPGAGRCCWDLHHSPGIGGWRRDRASAHQSAQQMLPGDYWRGPYRGPEHRPV